MTTYILFSCWLLQFYALCTRNSFFRSFFERSQSRSNAFANPVKLQRVTLGRKIKLMACQLASRGFLLRVAAFKFPLNRKTWHSKFCLRKNCDFRFFHTAVLSLRMFSFIRRNLFIQRTLARELQTFFYLFYQQKVEKKTPNVLSKPLQSQIQKASRMNVFKVPDTFFSLSTRLTKKRKFVNWVRLNCGQKPRDWFFVEVDRQSRRKASCHFGLVFLFNYTSFASLFSLIFLILMLTSSCLHWAKAMQATKLLHLTLTFSYSHYTFSSLSLSLLNFIQSTAMKFLQSSLRLTIQLFLSCSNNKYFANNFTTFKFKFFPILRRFLHWWSDVRWRDCCLHKKRKIFSSKFWNSVRVRESQTRKHFLLYFSLKKLFRVDRGVAKSSTNNSTLSLSSPFMTKSQLTLDFALFHSFPFFRWQLHSLRLTTITKCFFKVFFYKKKSTSWNSFNFLSWKTFAFFHSLTFRTTLTDDLSTSYQNLGYVSDNNNDDGFFLSHSIHLRPRLKQNYDRYGEADLW